MSANSIVKVNSLKWVKKDLLILLDEAKGQFQNYLEIEDADALHQVVKVLRQVSGTLTMVEVFGGAQLCDECIETAKQLLEQQVSNVAEAHEALLRALMHTAGYIDQVSATQKDQPSIVLPVVNDLRTVCGKELATDFETSLPSINDIKPDVEHEGDASITPAQMSQLAKKMRPQFQLGLVAWLKNPNDATALDKMQSVVSKLRTCSTVDAAGRLWWVSDGLIQSLNQGGIDAGTAVKSLLGKVDRQIKHLSEVPEDSFAEQIPNDLVRSILYYLSRAKSDTPVVQDVQEKLRQAGYESLDEAPAKSGPSDELLQTVSTSIKDDLNQAKDILDISGAKSDVDALGALPPLLTKIADTLGMIGLNETRVHVRNAAVEFSTQLEEANFDSASLPAVADALLEADNALQTYLKTRSPELAQSRQESGTQETLLNKVIDEAAKDLDDVREAILAHFAGTAEDGQIESSVDVISRISGAMFVEELQSVRPLVDGLKTVLEDRLISEQLTLTDAQQDVLADLIAAIEYYFIAVKEQKGDTSGYIRVGDAALSALMSIPSEHVSDLDVIEEETIQLQDVEESAIDLDGLDDVSENISLETESVETVQTLSEDAPTTPSASSFVLPVLLKDEDLPYSKDLTIIDDDVDDEILEIFIEECLEEHERISEMFPQWSANPEDQETRTTIRRSFHTLKGSGRLVGANLIGEYGWAMENMMNRLLEGQIERSPAMMSCIEDTIGLLPQMIEQLTGNKQPIKAAYDNMALAWSLAEGQPWQEEGANDALDSTSVETEETLADAPEEIVLEDEVSDVLSKEHLALLEQPETTNDDVSQSDSEALMSVLDDISIDDVPLEVDAIDDLMDVEMFHDDEATSSEAFDADAALSALDDIAITLESEEDALSSEEAEAAYQAAAQEELEREILFFAGIQEQDQAEALSVVSDVADVVEEAHVSADEELEREIRFFAGTQEQAQEEAREQEQKSRVVSNDVESDLEQQSSGASAELDVPMDELAGIEDQINLLNVAEPSSSPVLPQGHEYDLPEMDDVLAEIYTKESVMHILTVESQLKEIKSSGQLLNTNDELTRALHTLHGSSRTAQMHALADVAKQLELFGNAQLELSEAWPQQSVELLDEGMVQFRQALACLSDDTQAKPDLVGLLNRVQPLTENSQARVESKTDDIDESSDDTVIPVDNQDELVQMFIEECEELIDECDETLQQCEEQGFNETVIQELQRQMHTLKGGARMAELMPMGDLSHAIEEVVIDVQDQKIDGNQHVLSGLRLACDQLSAMLTEVKQHGQLSSSNKTMMLLEQVRTPGYVHDAANSAVAPAADVEPVLEPAVLPDTDTSAPTTVTEMEFSVNAKDELTAIFVDEAATLINQCDNLITEWEKDEYKGDKAEDIQRQLHTLKGGARMAALEPIGDLGQALEDAVNRVESGSIKPSETFVSLMNASTDKLSDMLSEIKTKASFSTANGLIAKLNALSGVESAADTDTGEPRKVEKQSRFDDVEAAPKAMTTGTVEQVRVSAHKLDQLVNNAGEVSIFHSRLAQRLNDFNFNLEELDQAVDRVQQHVRQISIETDAQIDSRIEQEATRDENFDPLEMDRYTQMQQLTRSLLETVSDLEDLRATFGGLVRDSETILVQQQRVSSSLQEGLMSTRMVNFEGLTSRFRRLARQTANTLNKKVDVYFSGVEHEVDRSIQENMISPLEHMIRNAISHGIESGAVRANAGKSDKGLINLSIDRDGSYIVIKLEDDGAGIDPDVIRQKAIERGLIEAQDTISDEEVIQFILHSGFSTAKQVTQISGRGVGMDVVSNEVKELGGTLSIQSSLGKGTTFVVRLPLTLAINQALMVAVEDQPYAVQLNAIEGVARVSTADLEQQYNSQKPLLKYGKQIYRVRYLPEMMGIQTPPDLKEDQQNSLLLVHLGDKRYAIHVDGILGRREVVVKPVGRQLSSMPGISGATILDDGKVALILELGGLIDHMDSKLAPVVRASNKPASQTQTTQQATAPVPEAPAVKPAAPVGKPTIMVVDDSITIRKVSTRFLERNHYKVVTAKDGMDAVAQLQEIKPDLMLLDIEMPRMDGYGVATHVRKTSTLKDLPIIMITSRTAEKHKQRAMDIGVNRYLGKPFQEDQLLENIEALLNGDDA